MSGRWESLEPFGSRVDEKALDGYVDELLKWNRAVRLIGPSDPDGAALQIIDSLLPFVFAAPSFPLLDIGSGAGLPAIPLAILWKGEEVVCVEPRAKRASFIRHASRVVGLNKVTAYCARAEELHPDASMIGKFATVTARAVADVKTLLHLARPFLAQGGRVILGRGGEEPAEVEGWRLLSHVSYSGPEGVKERSVVVYALK